MSRRLILLSLMLSAALAEDAPKTEPKLAYLAEIEVTLSGTEDPFPAFPLAPQKPNHYAFLKALRKAARDPEIDGVLLKIKEFGVGWARLLEVRQAMQQLRSSGKKVFVYLEDMTAPELVLASVADRISMPESGSVMIPGLAMESMYMKGLLDKLHVRFDVVHIGEYKSAGENLVRDSMSQELKDTLNPILDEFFDSMVNAVAEGRRMSREAVLAAVDKAIFSAKDAKAAGIIDRVEYEDQFNDGVKAFFPDRKIKIYRNWPQGSQKTQIDPDNPMAALTVVMGALFGGQKEARPEGPKVAVVYCSGTIVSGKSQYDWNGDVAAMGSETIAGAIDEAAKAEDVKAIVLRINSPGGSGLASDVIWRAIERAKQKKPVVASMGDVAASGGYFIAMNSKAIFAEPQTLTGSIGVVGMVPNMAGLFEWAGIRMERLSRGKHAEGLMTMKGLDEEQKEVLRQYMKAFYDDFVAKVAAGRGRTPAEIEPIARGRVWTGRKALEIGLVDRLGGIEDAIAFAREAGGIPADAEFHVMESPKRSGPLEFLENLLGAEMDAAALSKIPGIGQALAQIHAWRTAARDLVCCAAPEIEAAARIR